MKKMGLLDLDEVRQRLRIVEQSHAGFQSIEVSRIIGSLDRSSDFDRDFTPRRIESRGRLAQLRRAFPQGNFPPIEAYEAGGAYFVSDGHHRVVLAKEQGAAYIDARVTRLRTRFALDAEVDSRRLVHTDAQQTMLRESGLSDAKPGAVIDFTSTESYPALQEQIEAHGYRLIRARGEILRADEVAADWYERVYLPGIEAVRQESLAALRPDLSEADHFLWLYHRRRTLRLEVADAGFAHAARDARRHRLGLRGSRLRRTTRREQSTPLRTRRDQQSEELTRLSRG